jgi:hypothetical protein
MTQSAFGHCVTLQQQEHLTQWYTSTAYQLPKFIPSYYVTDNEQTSERIKKYVFMIYNSVFSISLHIWRYYKKRNACVYSYNLKLALRLNSIKSTFFLHKRGLKMTA